MNYNLPKRPEYQHPGRLFLQGYGVPTTQKGVVQYANYLLRETRQAKFAPVKLSAIRWRFGLKTKFVNLPSSIQGFADHTKGEIFVNSNDHENRQRFTEAHEMIELLYKACEESPLWDNSIFANISESRKEQLCHKGAAAILMPKEPFMRDMGVAPPSLDRASRLAETYKASLTATVHRMVAVSSYPCAMIIWQQPECNEQSKDSQACNETPLQVWWAESSTSMPYISSGQFTDNKLICNAFGDNKIRSGTGHLCFKTITGSFCIDAKRVAFGNTRYVMSLIQNPFDRS